MSSIANDDNLFVICYKKNNCLFYYSSGVDVELSPQKKIDLKIQKGNSLDINQLYWAYYNSHLEHRDINTTLTAISSNGPLFKINSLSMFGQLDSGDISVQQPANFRDVFIKYQYINTQRQIEFLRNFNDEFTETFKTTFQPNSLSITYPAISYKLESIIYPFVESLKTTQENLTFRINLTILLILSNYTPYKFPNEIEIKKSLSDDSVITSLFDKIRKESEKDTPILKKAQQAINKTKLLVDYIIENSTTRNLSEPIILKYGKNTKDITLNHENLNAIDFYNKIIESLGIEFQNVLNLSWKGLSAGEEVILNQFGIFFELFKQIEDSNIILLCIDEGETSLHPQWQKKYLNALIKFLPKLLKENQNIQLLLTSHSPFLASDLPKDNIIFLNKKDNGECEVKQPEDMTHTFGANIHSLYRNSFFLENGLMGEFAKGKIDSVIHALTDKRKTPKTIVKNKDEYQFIIDQIGEPLLKSRLQKLLNERLNQTLSKEDKFKELENKLTSSLTSSELQEFIQNLNGHANN